MFLQGIRWFISPGAGDSALRVAAGRRFVWSFGAGLRAVHGRLRVVWLRVAQWAPGRSTAGGAGGVWPRAGEGALGRGWGCLGVQLHQWVITCNN